ncbi:hypothetical protein BLOT_005503 [Blomia tropicalis]|nr:hypothetical protein BLOT_005503 [Blomia tropicalis]
MKFILLAAIVSVAAAVPYHLPAGLGGNGFGLDFGPGKFAFQPVQTVQYVGVPQPVPVPVPNLVDVPYNVPVDAPYSVPVERNVPVPYVAKVVQPVVHKQTVVSLLRKKIKLNGISLIYSCFPKQLIIGSNNSSMISSIYDLMIRQYEHDNIYASPWIDKI